MMTRILNPAITVRKECFEQLLWSIQSLYSINIIPTIHIVERPPFDYSVEIKIGNIFVMILTVLTDQAGIISLKTMNLVDFLIQSPITSAKLQESIDQENHHALFLDEIDAQERGDQWLNENTNPSSNSFIDTYSTDGKDGRITVQWQDDKPMALFVLVRDNYNCTVLIKSEIST